MFEYNEKTGAITLIRGNSGALQTTPYNAETEEEIRLDEDDKILFCVQTPSKRQVIKKVLTVNDYDADGNLVITFSPTDTLLHPFTYEYGFTYIPNDCSEAQTYASGSFVVLDDCGTVEDVIIKVEPEEPVPDDETDEPIIEPTEPDESGEVNG